MSTKSFRDHLRVNRWLGSLEPRVGNLTASKLQARELTKGSHVYLTGDAPNGFFGVLSGQVRLSTQFKSGRSLLNHMAEPGDWFGETSTLDGRPRINDAVCAGPVMLACLPHAAAQELLRTEVEFARALGALASRHHRSAMAFAARALSQPVSAQLAHVLLSLERRAAAAGQGGAALKLRQEDLANMIGLSRQTVAPLLQKMQNQTIVRLGYGAITILDHPALEREAQRTLP